MKRIEDIEYKDIDMVSRSYAGLDGFEFRLTNEEFNNVTLVTIFQSDLKLASAVDNALRKQYHKPDKE